MSQLEQDALYKARAFGNLTASSTNEVMVCARGYAEPASEAQRSVVSTSAQDASGGSGAKKVELVYLTSNYELKTEILALNGTTPVNTVASDIRFVERLHVIEGAAAAGAIKLMTQTGGGGTEIAGIGVGTETAFLCHHYVPVGKKAYLLAWGATCDDEAKFKLKTQARYPDGGLVDENADLYNLTAGNPTPPTHLEFWRSLDAAPIVVGEKTYCRVTVVPNQATSTIIRAYLCWWEE